MSMRKIVASLIVAMGVAAILSMNLGSMILGGEAVLAQNTSPEYTFLVASGFLFDSGSCPAVARSARRDTYEFTGAGTFNPQSKSVHAAGTFARKAPSGSVLETGVWLSSQLLSFDSYGIAPAALRQRGIAPGIQAFRPKPMPMSLSAIPVGGLAVFRIRLLPVSGMPMTALLQVNCALGDTPRDRSSHGIQLKLENSSTEFSEELGGSVMFLAMPPQSTPPGKESQQAPGSAAPPTPN